MTEADPVISIITATYNAAAQLPACAASIRRYGSAHSEWIVVDGGSNDGTLEWLQAAGPELSLWISEADRGVYDAMNKGVALAKGRFILFLGADDRLLPGFQTALHQLQDPSTLYYGNVKRLQSGQEYAGEVSRRRMSHTNVCQQSICYPTWLLKEQPFDLQYPIQSDWAYNMACWNHPGLTLHYLPNCLAEFNDAQGLSSTKVDHAFNRDYGRLLRRHYTFRDCWKPWLIHRLSRIYRSLPGCAEPDTYQ